MGLGDIVENIYRKLTETGIFFDPLGAKFNTYYDQTIELYNKESYEDSKTAGRNALACLSEIVVDYKNKESAKKIGDILYLLTMIQYPPPLSHLDYRLDDEGRFEKIKEKQKKYCLDLVREYALHGDFKYDLFSRIDRTF
ncbi:MAG: hypothetical protein CVU81_02805 [Euryarchaeota archaeon HGW-Euryarchaeota-1]|nr:MAG: hypothetical protein CVU81_02805 [Euryarchaeota archaeon HGW-Euryarchaeota-1]